MTEPDILARARRAAAQPYQTPDGKLTADAILAGKHDDDPCIEAAVRALGNGETPDDLSPTHSDTGLPWLVLGLVVAGIIYWRGWL